MRRKEHRRGHRRALVGLGTAAAVATAAGIAYKLRGPHATPASSD